MVGDSTPLTKLTTFLQLLYWFSTRALAKLDFTKDAAGLCGSCLLNHSLLSDSPSTVLRKRQSLKAFASRCCLGIPAMVIENDIKLGRDVNLHWKQLSKIINFLIEFSSILILRA